jgi:hypothetical protein
MNRVFLGLTAAAACVALGAGAFFFRKSAPAPDGGAAEAGYFRDRTPDSGVRHTYRNGQEAGHYAILESQGGGVALIDYDGDGLLDIYVPGGGYYDKTAAEFDKDRSRPPRILGHPGKLYRNLGNWKFQDVSKEVGLDDPLFYTHGCAVADYDRDGWPDLLVTGWGRLALYRNVPDPQAPGGRRFVEVTKEVGLNDTLWSTSAAWADLDGDGYPELYVCHYGDWSFANHPFCSYRDNQRDVCPPRQFKSLPHTLYRNNKGKEFTDVSEQAGLYQNDAKKHSKGLGVVIVDFNDDGRPDIYVANDETQNLFYLNRGGLKFDEQGLLSGVALDDNGTGSGSMGVDAGDYDGSGRPSILVTNYQNEIHHLFRNLGGEQFAYASRSAGIAAIGTNFVGFGVGFIDFDCDGHLDVFATNGHVIRHPPPPGQLKQRPVLLWNLRRPGDSPHKVRFADVSDKAGPFFRGTYMGRGAAFGDLDNDGKIDVVISHVNEPVALLQNVLDNGNHWLGVELVGKGHRDLAGAKLTLEVGGEKLVRFVKGGGSYLSASDPRVVFGLGRTAEAGRLTVRWPWGQEQSWDRLPADRYWRLTEGEKQPRPPRHERRGK